MTTSALTQGAHHIGLTVPDLTQTRSFFLDILGFDQVGEIPDYPAVFLTDGATMITLWQAGNPETAVKFDRKNVIGLHHLALKVEDTGALDHLYNKLKSIGEIDIEFPPESLGCGPTKHMICAIPGGIRVEFIAIAG